jgi:hypothetical protein
MYITVVGLRSVSAHYYLGKLWTTDVQIVNRGIGAGGKCEKYQGLIVTCNHVMHVVIFCAIVLLILFGKFARSVNRGISGLLSLRNYSSEIVNNRYVT